MNTHGQGIWDLWAAENCSLRILAPMVRGGFTYLSKIERGKPDFGEFPSANQIQRLASEHDAYKEELLLSQRIPATISKHIFEQPETFRKLAQCDSSRIDRMVENIQLEKLMKIGVRKPK